MNAPKDLTRWNRAGLNQFKYVNGNAVEYLEILRQHLVKQFKNPKTELCEWINPAEEIPHNEQLPESANETMLQRQERLSRKQKRLLETYHQDRRDWAWEISRTFARSCHILTEHANAYTNEGYLGTATQWDHVRRLVEMLDYHPAPPASASTRLVLIAKEKNTGTIGKGFQIKNSPLVGADKVIFETLEDVFIDPALNELRPSGWDQSNESASLPLNEEQQTIGEVTAATSWRVPKKNKIDPADIVMIFREYKDENSGEYKDDAEAATVANVDLQTNAIHLTPSPVQDQKNWLNWKKHEARLRVAPRWRRKCWLNGPGVIRTEKDHGLTAGSFIGWMRDWNTTSVWDFSRIEYAEILEVDKRNLRLKYGYKLHLINNAGDLVDEGKSLVIVAFLNSQLSIRIFNSAGEKVVDKTENDLLVGSALTAIKNLLNPFPEVINLTQEEKQNFIENAAACADYTLLPEQHTALIKLLPIDESILSADYGGIVLLDAKGEPDNRGDVLEDVSPKIDDSPFGSIFTIQLPPASSGVSGGGGLLPPASLPKIGSFLFPSPMLPMDLVKIAVELMLSLGVMQIPSSKEFVIKGIPISIGDPLIDIDTATALYEYLDGLFITNLVNAGGDSISNVKVIQWKEDFSAEEDTDKVTAIKARLAKVMDKAGSPSALFKEIMQGIVREGPLLAAPLEPQIISVVSSNFPRYIIEGSVKKIKSGDWLVGEFFDGHRAVKLNSLQRFDEENNSESYAIGFDNESDLNCRLIKLYTEFRNELISEGANVNVDSIDEESIVLQEVPESLKIGREVLLECEGKDPVLAKIVDVAGNTVKIDSPVYCCALGKLIIRGNVVLAGHGETKPAKILGSGDASKTNQEFTLQVEGVSFTDDATMSSGVAAAIEVEVEGRVWQQVSSLKDSASSDHHYAIRMTEQAYVKIMFGDGEKGRRLPSGKNNIRVRYRVGSGIVGNLAVGELNKAVNPHPLLKEVFQPIAATGGGDMEDISSLRENAPPTLLALERAVSLSDFSYLAAAQSSIWQAKAYSEILHGGRTESVRVVIVPAGGVTSTTTEDEVEDFLQKHAMPGVQVTVDDCFRVRFSLSITLRVILDAFVATDVKNAVLIALQEHFALKNRKLGQNLFLSEVYKVVEFIEGVENSICVLNNNKQLSVIPADDSTVIYLDTEAKDTPSSIDVSVEEYVP